MFSVSPSEILTIAVVALLVFGPKRLPEIARKAGKVIRDLRNVATELTAGLEDEYQQTLEPFRDIRTTMKDAIAGVERGVMETADPPASNPARPGTAADLPAAAASPGDADPTAAGDTASPSDPDDDDS